MPSQGRKIVQLATKCLSSIASSHKRLIQIHNLNFDRVCWISHFNSGVSKQLFKVFFYSLLVGLIRLKLTQKRFDRQTDSKNRLTRLLYRAHTSENVHFFQLSTLKPITSLEYLILARAYNENYVTKKHL